ncbi:D-alanyl-D-alanine carboxypeptidase, partial [Flavihumibacter sp. CACIAM 22H1]|uniref:D-alanyl-D-alanine carboxypeptidase n=1 Tax=Flavihumibacter sp. CACIAM 22H1 TaxID=1812911 RepID=UPI0025C07F8B
MAWKQFTGLIGWLLTGMIGICQSVPTQLNQQVERVVRDPTMKHALLSVSVLDASTGKAIYQYQEQVGLAPASTLKLLTAITSLALLGPDFKFETSIGYTGEIIAGRLNGDLVLK